MKRKEDKRSHTVKLSPIIKKLQSLGIDVLQIDHPDYEEEPHLSWYTAVLAGLEKLQGTVVVDRLPCIVHDNLSRIQATVHTSPAITDDLCQSLDDIVTSAINMIGDLQQQVSELQSRLVSRENLSAKDTLDESPGALITTEDEAPVYGKASNRQAVPEDQLEQFPDRPLPPSQKRSVRDETVRTTRSVKPGPWR